MYCKIENIVRNTVERLRESHTAGISNVFIEKHFVILFLDTVFFGSYFFNIFSIRILLLAFFPYIYISFYFIP